MSYGVKYRLTWASPNHLYRIDIEKNGYSGSVISRRMGNAPTLVMDNADNGICGTSLNFAIEAKANNELLELYTTDPRGFRVKLYKGNTLIWIGFVSTELYSESYVAPPYDVAITATDCLGLLKNNTFNLSGEVSFLSLLLSILESTGLDIALNVISTLSTTAAATSTFLEGITSNVKFLQGSTLYEVLEKFCQTFDFCITQYNAEWILFRINDLTAGAVKHKYTSVGVYAGTSYINHSSVGALGSADLSPIGSLSMAISPAVTGNIFKLEAALTKSMLTSPDMDSEAGWTGSDSRVFVNESYTTNGITYLRNYYVLGSKNDNETTYAQVIQSIPISGTGFDEFITYKLEISYAVTRRATYMPTGQQIFLWQLDPKDAHPIHLYLKFTTATGNVMYFTGGTWTTNETALVLNPTPATDAWKNKENFDTIEFSSIAILTSGTLDIIFVNPMDTVAGAIVLSTSPDENGSPVDEVALAGRIEAMIGRCYLTSNYVPSSMQVQANYDSNAVGPGPEVITYWDSFYGVANADILTYNRLLASGSLTGKTWNTDRNSLRNSLLGTIIWDYGQRVGQPRRRFTGSVLGSEFPALLLEEQFSNIILQVEEYSLNLLDDEASISAVEVRNSGVDVIVTDPEETAESASSSATGGSSGGGTKDCVFGQYFDVQKDAETGVTEKVFSKYDFESSRAISGKVLYIPSEDPDDVVIDENTTGIPLEDGRCCTFLGETGFESAPGPAHVTSVAWADSANPAYGNLLVNQQIIATLIKSTAIGAAHGVCPLGSDQRVPTTYLPSYVDDVIEAYVVPEAEEFSSGWLTDIIDGYALTPEAGKIYIVLSSGDYFNRSYRWSGSTYVCVSSPDYAFSVATTNVLGGVLSGNDIDIDSTGLVSVKKLNGVAAPAELTRYGVVFYDTISPAAYGCTGSGSPGSVLQANDASAPSWVETTANATANTLVRRDDETGGFAMGPLEATTGAFSGNVSVAGTFYPTWMTMPMSVPETLDEAKWYAYLGDTGFPVTGSSSAVGDIISITGPTEGQVLAYNATTGKFENTTANLTGNYLPLTGGTLTGALIVSANITGYQGKFTSLIIPTAAPETFENGLHYIYASSSGFDAEVGSGGTGGIDGATLWGQSLSSSNTTISGSLSNTGNITPETANYYSIGSSTLPYASGYFYSMYFAGAQNYKVDSLGRAVFLNMTLGTVTQNVSYALYVQGTSHFKGDITYDSNVTIGSYSLKAACGYDVTTSVIQGSTALITSGAVYTAIQNITGESGGNAEWSGVSNNGASVYVTNYATLTAGATSLTVALYNHTHSQYITSSSLSSYVRTSDLEAAVSSYCSSQGYMTSTTANSTYVTIATAQTITGAKTFSANTTTVSNLTAGGTVKPTYLTLPVATPSTLESGKWYMYIGTTGFSA